MVRKVTTFERLSDGTKTTVDSKKNETGFDAMATNYNETMGEQGAFRAVLIGIDGPNLLPNVNHIEVGGGEELAIGGDNSM